MAKDEMTLPGTISPPMANGEVVFEAPWQSRIFGMARVLCEQGQFEWDEFRQCLIARIESWEKSCVDKQDAGTETNYQYFDHFFFALTDLISQKGICSTEELRQKSTEFNARPHGHDH